MVNQRLDDMLSVGGTSERLWSELGSLTVEQALLDCGLAVSRGDAARVFNQGGIRVNHDKTVGDRQLTDLDLRYPDWSYDAHVILLQRGKKQRHRLGFRLPDIPCPQCGGITDVIDLRGMLPSFPMTDDPLAGECDICGWRGPT